MSQQVRRVESVFPGADGLSLLQRGWLPERAARQLLLVHGFGEHSARYDAMGEWFASRGWAVHGYDHRGHGRSEGHRNYVGRFDEYGGDLRRFCERLEADAAGGPRFLVGHSMGALVVMCMLTGGRLLNLGTRRGLVESRVVRSPRECAARRLCFARDAR